MIGLLGEGVARVGSQLRSEPHESRGIVDVVPALKGLHNEAQLLRSLTGLGVNAISTPVNVLEQALPCACFAPRK